MTTGSSPVSSTSRLIADSSQKKADLLAEVDHVVVRGSHIFLFVVGYVDLGDVPLDILENGTKNWKLG